MKEIRFRAVQKEDCDLLFKWANDPIVRQNSFNINPIPYDDHCIWFSTKMKSKTTLIFIGYVKDAPIGQIRIEIEDKIGLINYSIDNVYRGQGYGTLILAKISEEVKTINPKLQILIGKVKINNISSQKAFEHAGFIKNYISESEYIEYKKPLE